jgi:hypothetical protein
MQGSVRGLLYYSDISTWTGLAGGRMIDQNNKVMFQKKQFACETHECFIVVTLVM